MNKVYNDLTSIGGISSINKLYKEVKKLNDKITYEDVKSFLKTKSAYTLNKVKPIYSSPK